MDTLLHEAPCGIFSFTDNGLLQQVNKSFCEMLGYTDAELKHKKLEELFTIPTRIFHQTHFFPLLKMQGHAEEIFLTLKTKDGRPLPVLVNARRVNDTEPETICACMPVHNRQKYEEEILEAKRTAEKALQENTELVQAKKQLQENVEQLDKRLTRLKQRNDQLHEFSHIISHDLQEPLRKLSVFSDMLRRDTEANGKASRIIDKIVGLYSRMRNMVLGLQQFVWLDQEEKETASVDLNEVVREAYEKVKEEKYADFQLYAEQLPVIEGYKNQLALLFYHLFENANKFKKPASAAEVTISASLVQHNSFKILTGKYKYVDFVKIECSDNGMGILEKHSDYVFRLFKKINAETEGLGLGLAFCKKIIENHYGSIKVSEGPSGTLFTILLPLHQSA
jgi:sigma-B regulation protein RsbU (phosphoserine phosphatase)